MDEGEIERPETVPEDHTSAEAKQKVYSAPFDEQLDNEQEGYDVHPKHDHV